MPEDAVASEKLETWKAIADYLERHERTVKRWEAERGLPVHRLPGDQRSVVFAFTRELDAWLVTSIKVHEGGPDLGGGGVLTKTPEDESDDLPSKSGNHSGAEVLGSAPRQRIPGRWSRRTAVVASLMTGFLLIAGIVYFSFKLSSRVKQLADQQQLTSNGLEKRGLLTDGKTLYFAEDHDGRFALVSMLASGGPVRLLWGPAADVLPIDISPDGKKMIALVGGAQQYEKALWILPLDRGAPRRLPNIAAHSAAWSPDGRTIAYSAGSRIYLTAESDSIPREIGSFSGLPIVLLWSQDGQSLRFILQEIPSNRTRTWGQLSGDGMKTATIRPLPVSMYDGGFWTRTPVGAAIFVQGGLRKLRSRTVSMIHYSSHWWEPSLQTVPAGSVLGDIYGIAYSEKPPRLSMVVEPHTTATFIAFDRHAHAFRSILPGASGLYLDYSRDGKWVAYTGDEDRGLFISRADGTGIREVVSGPEPMALPRWSPDGRQIAYMTQRPDRPWRIYILQLDSGAVREASEGSDGQGAPTWSPDGRSIVYGNVNCGYTLSCGIHRVDLDTGRVKSLPNSEGFSTARCSPDGRFVVAQNAELRQLMLFDVKGGTWRKFADAVDGADLSWSADSKYVYANIGGPDSQIVRLRISDGKRETAVDFRSQDKLDLADTDDLQFSIAPDDSVILHRRIHAEEIFTFELRDQ